MRTCEWIQLEGLWEGQALSHVIEVSRTDGLSHPLFIVAGPRADKLISYTPQATTVYVCCSRRGPIV